MQKKLFIFDMDGTLVNSSLTIANAINYVRQNLGFEPMDKAYILSRVNDHSINPAQVFYHAKVFDKSHEKWFSEYYSKNHKRELVLYEGIKPLLLALKAKGYTLAVATNAYRISTLESLRYLEIEPLFDAIVCADDVNQAKPHADMLIKILEDLGISTKESLFVGDGSRDKMASDKAKIDYIMVDWGFSEHEDAIRTVEELKTHLLTY
ncbi:MAG: HAD family hydrolase [Sulfurovum sp.]|nr:HAD family hydrolase [Sulfurovum sp.]